MTAQITNQVAFKLNEKQQECVETINGPVMVLAGPGTGKTTVVIKRIEAMIEKGIEPSSILALTFSEAAANEMKIRLLNQVGNKASAVVIHTYHAFCADIINQNSLRFELLDDFNVVDDLNKSRLMREAVSQFRPKHLVTQRGDAFYYVRYLINAVHDIKLNRLTKENYFNVLENDDEWLTMLKAQKADISIQQELEKQGKRNRLKTLTKEIEKQESKIKKAQEVWEIYEIYSKKLASNGFIDFDDMINLVLTEFENDPAFLEEISSQFDYLLVDEYQDTNHSQNELIFKLASDNSNANLFVVGDDDQIIYSFQGAQIDNLERFIRLYPAVKIICLQENNRSTQTILDLCYEIISQDPSRIEANEEFEKYKISKKLTAKNKDIISKTKKVELNRFTDIIQENNFIIERIESLIKDNPALKLSEIAVLTRTNSELEFFADQLKARNIPYQVSKQKDIFAIKPTLLIYLYLKAIENPATGSMGLFGMIAHPPFNFHAADFNFISTEYLKTREDLISIITKNLKKRNWKDKTVVDQFINTFVEIKAAVNKEKLGNLVVRVLNETGILKFYADKQLNKLENISAIKTLVDEVRKFEKITHPATLTMLLTYLDESIRDKINIEIDDADFTENSVQLITIHKSKGREFSHLFIPNLISKNWEKRRSIETIKLPIKKAELTKESEIAKLQFVACSRAKHSLVMSYSTISKGKNTELSCFIQKATAREDLVETTSHNLTSEQFVDEIVRMYSTAILHQQNDFKDVLKLRAKAHVMSPSSLYLYNRCPKQFLYQYIFRIPVLETYQYAFSFGTAVHKALEKFIKYAQQKKAYPKQEAMLKYFKTALEKEIFVSVDERDRAFSQGIKVLNDYYKYVITNPIDKIRGVEENIDMVSVGNYFVKGKIDLIVENEHGKIIVKDFKTGNRNLYKKHVTDPEGAKHHYMKQLQFYKLLYESVKPEKQVTLGVLELVEVPEKNVYIDLTSEDREYIKEQILSTFEKIVNLEFKGIDEEKQQAKPCEDCKYRLICSLNAL